MKKILFTFFIFAFAFGELPLLAQPSFTWQRLYDVQDNFDNYSFDICSDNRGNFYSVGQVNASYPPYYLGYILKITGFGDTIWSKIFNVSYPRAVASSGDGGCVFVGHGSYSVKLDSNGNIEWFKLYGEDTVYGGVQCFDIKKTIDKGYIIGGNCNSVTYGYLIKIDSNGNYVWSKSFPATDYIRLTSVVEAIDGGYVAFGTSTDYSATDPCAIAIKVDTAGSEVWRKIYFVNNDFTKGYVINRFNNGYILTGNSGLSNFLIKINTLGDTLFSKCYPYGNGEYEEFSTSNITHSNNIVLSFGINNANGTYNKLLIADSSGTILKEKNYYGVGLHSYVKLLSIFPLGSGDLLFSGYSDYYDNENDDVYIIRTDSTLFSPPISVKKIAAAIPHNFTLYQNYPNPFNPVTKIKFDIPPLRGARGVTQLIIYDILGREAVTLVNQQLNPGTYEVEWDGSNYPSGVYFYKLMVKGYSETKKMVLIK